MNRIQIGAALAIAATLGGWLSPVEFLTPAAATIRPQDPAATIAMLEQRLAAYRHLLSDWAGLTRYGSEDSEIKPPAPGENRVVFIGDQITEFWGRGQGRFFPAALTSIGASVDRPRRRCSCDSGRTSSP